MDIGKASLVICLTLVAVIAINLLIYFTLRGGIKFKEIDIMQQITSSSRKPWKKEMEELEELSKLVDDLKLPIEQDKKKNINDV